MHDLQIKSDDLIDAVAAATRVSSTYLIECARRMREAGRGDLEPLYVREKKGPGSPLQGTRQAANLIFASLQTASPRGLPDAIERAEFTQVRYDSQAIYELDDPNAAPWIRFDLPRQPVRLGYEASLQRLMDSGISFIRALEFSIVAAWKAPDEFERTWAPMTFLFDGDRNEGRIVADYTGRDRDKDPLVFRYVDPRLPENRLGVHRESWLTGEIIAEVGRAFRFSEARLVKAEPRATYGA